MFKRGSLICFSVVIVGITFCGVTDEGERKFSFAVISDIHIGKGYDDYGTEGYEDSAGQEYYLTERLREVVEKINRYREVYDLRFVVILGDLTERGEFSAYEKLKEILDQLEIPYVPVLGNHDVWPHTRGNNSMEASSPIGDRYFLEVFKEELENLRGSFSNFVIEDFPVFNPECNCYSYFVNYGFDLEGYHFVVLDFVNRRRNRTGFGAFARAELHEFENGSWNWFKSHLDSYPFKGDRNIIVFSHHPPLVNSSGVESFSQQEVDKVNGYFNESGYGRSVYGFFSGHLHRDDVTTMEGGQYIVVTDAMSEGVKIRVVQIMEGGVIDFSSFIE